MSLALERESVREEHNAMGSLLRAKDPETGVPFGYNDLTINFQSLLYVLSIFS